MQGHSTRHMDVGMGQRGEVRMGRKALPSIQAAADMVAHLLTGMVRCTDTAVLVLTALQMCSAWGMAAAEPMQWMRMLISSGRTQTGKR